MHFWFSCFRCASALKRGIFVTILLTGLLSVSASAQDGQSGSINGRVFNAETGRYVGRALVEVQGTSTQTFTDQFGEYRLYGLDAGTVELRVSYTGQTPVTATVQVLSGSTATRDFTLGRARPSVSDGEDGDAFELADFEVSARDSFQTASELAIQQERYSVNLMNVVSTDAYGITAQGNVGEFVKFIPGVTIGYGGGGTAGGNYASGADANTISIRGHNARETTITIDGMPIANAAPGTLDPATGLDMMSINDASRVEVIKVPSPDEPDAGLGGRVNLVSKTAFEYPRPTLNFRLYVTANSSNLDIFKKSPGPMNKRTYKTLPSVDMTYAHPVNDKFGYSLTLASVHQAQEGRTLKTNIRREASAWDPSTASPTATISAGGNSYNTWIQNDPRLDDWQAQYGDWHTWSEADVREMYANTGLTEAQVDGLISQVKYLPRYDSNGNLLGSWSPNDLTAYQEGATYYDADGNLVGNVHNDWAHPYVDRVQVTDSPRISHRNSAALKFDYRPIDGLLLTANYRYSSFEDQDAGRRVQQRVGSPTQFGPDWVISENGGNVNLDTDAFTREGTTHSGYLRGSYIKGPWNISGHASYSTSESAILTAEDGHFSVVEVRMGNIDYTEFLGISGVSVPQEINHYRNIEDDEGNVISRELIDISDISNYGIANYDPEDPNAATLKVRAANINAESERTTAKFDIRRDLDFIPGDFMNLAIKVGGDWQEQKESKSGRGTNYEYLYIGQEAGGPLDITDFRDENYIGVDPGFGLKPLEWPDVYALYDYHINNPGAFSDTNDDVPTGSSEALSVAANNYMQEVNTSKAITETETAYYAQLEGQFFNNRLSVVGGFRYTESERKGNNPTQNNRWNVLAFNEDANNDGFYDIIENYEGIEVDPSIIPGGVLPAFDVTQMPALSEVNPSMRSMFETYYGYYEQVGAVYADGTPFIASEHTTVTDRTLRATQLRYVKDYQIDQASRGKPQPIISAAYDITDKLVGRVSWATAYSNPPFESSQGAGATLREIRFNEQADGSGDMTITNPNLDIAKSTNWDASLTYYTDAGGKFSVAGFYSTESNRALSVEYSASTSFEAWDALMRDLGYGPGSVYYDNRWRASSDINADGDFIRYGYELEARQDLAFIGDWGKYIYLYGSFFQEFQDSSDLVTAEEEGEIDLSDDDELRLNASGGLSVSYKRLSLRANFTWRNERTQSTTEAIFWRDPLTGNPGWYTPSRDDDEVTEGDLVRIKRVRPEDLRIDLNASYRLTDRFTLDFSARNITKSNPQDIYKVDGGDAKLPHFGQMVNGPEKKIFGIDFTLGISGRF